MEFGSTLDVNNLAHNTYRHYTDDIGAPGNFMIRATGRSSLPGNCPPTYTRTPTATPTHTPTPTATACLVATVSGAITGSDPVQTGRLVRDAVSSSCLLPQ